MKPEKYTIHASRKFQHAVRTFAGSSHLTVLTRMTVLSRLTGAGCVAENAQRRRRRRRVRRASDGDQTRVLLCSRAALLAAKASCPNGGVAHLQTLRLWLKVWVCTRTELFLRVAQSMYAQQLSNPSGPEPGCESKVVTPLGRCQLGLSVGWQIAPAGSLCLTSSSWSSRL